MFHHWVEGIALFDETGFPIWCHWLDIIFHSYSYLNYRNSSNFPFLFAKAWFSVWWHKMLLISPFHFLVHLFLRILRVFALIVYCTSPANVSWRNCLAIFFLSAETGFSVCNRRLKKIDWKNGHVLFLFLYA